MSIVHVLTLRAHAQPVIVPNTPDGCEAEVCMSHMDPVSGTDIDLLIIPCSLHLEHKKQRLNLKSPLLCKMSGQKHI